MSKLGAVIQREYVTRVRTKGFIIGTLLFPVIIIFLFGGIFIFAQLFAPSTKNYAVIDQTGKIYTDFVKLLPDTLKNGKPKFTFHQMQTTDPISERTFSALQKRITNKEIDGYIFVPKNVIETKKVKYAARNVSDFEELNDLQRSLSHVIANLRLSEKGFPAEDIRQEMAKGWIQLESHQVTEKGEVSKHGASSFLLTYLLSYMLLLFIMTSGQTVTRSVIEEKSQRITETIISSINARDLMLGKMLGICLLGITQLIVIGGFVYGTSIFGAPLFVKAGIQIPKLMNILENLHFSPVIFIFFILFFFMGFFLYAGLFAAIGAMVNTNDEGQQFLLPIVILNLMGFFIMFSVAKNPETTSAFWASLFPFFTPVVMFARIAVMDPILPSGAIISLFTLALSIIILIKFVAKIYRVGILMYGKKPSLKEALKWIKYK